jgi:hypothetical protein
MMNTSPNPASGCGDLGNAEGLRGEQLRAAERLLREQASVEREELAAGCTTRFPKMR